MIDSSSLHPTDENLDRPPIQARYVRSEIRFHALFLGMAGVILMMSVLMTTDGVRSVYLPGFSQPLPDSCTSRRLLGIDCPGCGMTRAFISISHGELARAWSLNHASFIVYAFVVVQIPWHSIQIVRLYRNQRPLDWNYVYMMPVAVAVILALNWVWTLYRMQ